MRLLLNIVWLVFFGWVIALFAYLFGLVLTLLLITAPVGLGLMEYGKFLLAPFSREMISQKQLGLDADKNVAWKSYSTIVMIVYVLTFGIVLSVLAAITAVGQFCTIIGIPNAYVLAKSVGTLLNPVGKKCISKDVSDEIRRREATIQTDKLLNK